MFFTFRPQCGRNTLTTGEIFKLRTQCVRFLFSGCLKSFCIASAFKDRLP
ncbi:MAG: hypothetical protein IJ187_02720 [Neisseriaceae bacterium]|nr:hypothetical protein [Neisseriaceae bacterium]